MATPVAWDEVEETRTAIAPLLLKFQDQFSAIMGVVDAFVVSHGMVYAPPHASLLLRAADGDSSVGTPSIPWTILSASDTAVAMQELAREIFGTDSAGLTRLTVGRTVVAHRDFVISVDGIDIVIIKTLPSFRGVRTMEAIEPMMARGAVGHGMLPCVPPELILIDTYAGLCSPARAGEWAELFATRRSLNMILVGSGNVKGGRDRRDRRDRRDGKHRGKSIKKRHGKHEQSHEHDRQRCREHHDQPVDEIDKLICDELIRSAENAVVGSFATDGEVAVRLQVVTARSLDDVRKSIMSVAGSRRGDITAPTNDPLVPGDPRLRRMTVYRSSSGGKVAIADVYNAGEHELIPTRGSTDAPAGASPRVKEEHGRVGTLVLVLRFILIDLWTIRVLRRSGVVGSDRRSPCNLEKYHLCQYMSVSDRLDAVLANPDTSEWGAEFPSSSACFIGKWIDPALANSRHIRAERDEQKKFYHAFVPALAGRHAWSDSLVDRESGKMMLVIDDFGY